MANAKLLNETAQEIETRSFLWNQGDWAGSVSDPKQGMDTETFKNECGTVYCFAGRVASRKREQLYMYNYTGESGEEFFDAVGYFIPDVNDPEDIGLDMYSTVYRTVVDNGQVRFIPYEGKVVAARQVAIHDLDINEDEADNLFHASNSLADIQAIVKDIIDSAEH